MEKAKLIKNYRIKKGLTQEELANKTEVSARTIQRIENGEVNPRAYTLQMIAKALELDFSQFTDEHIDPKEAQEPSKPHVFGFLHLSGVLPLLLPTWILWKHRTDKTEEMAKHFRATLSMQLCILAIALTTLWIYWRVNEITPFVITLLMGALVSILNAISVTNGKPFINPFIKSSSNTDKLK